jgi:hypothetical protein
MSGGVRRLQVFRIRKLYPGLSEASLQILKLSGFPDLHQSENIETEHSDHPDDGILFRIGFSCIGPESPIDPPAHGQIVLHVIGGDAEARRGSGS